MSIQTGNELDEFYSDADPWGYERNVDDQRRRVELLASLPRTRFRRCLDIGCGNGFVTFSLPAEQVMGVDISAAAIAWAEKASTHESQPERFSFRHSSIFQLDESLGTFDLIVITGVLYDQYIGRGAPLIRNLIDARLECGGTLVSCHIRSWNAPRFPYTLLDMNLYPYREFTHQLEVYRK